MPKQSNRMPRQGGEEEERPQRVQAQQLLDYIMAANEDHYSQADTAVRGNLLAHTDTFSFLFQIPLHLACLFVDVTLHYVDHMS